MIHKYKIEISKDKRIPIHSDTDYIDLNKNYRVSWKTNDEKYLEVIFIELLGQSICYNEEGVILTSYPEIDATAYNISVYLSNSILIQTSIEAFDPVKIIADSPELIPETEEEAKRLKSTKKRKYTSIAISYDILSEFKPNDYKKYFLNTSAVAHFANGLRSHEPSIKFEQFYKVVEAIFKKGRNEDAIAFDKRVSDHILTFDTRFNDTNLKKLRQLRNRCVHPNANLGHLSPDDLIAVREIKSYLPIMQELARLSMDYQPD